MNLVGTKLLEKNQGELHLELDCVVKVRFSSRRCSERSISAEVCVCVGCVHTRVRAHAYVLGVFMKNPECLLLQFKVRL